MDGDTNSDMRMFDMRVVVSIMRIETGVVERGMWRSGWEDMVRWRASLEWYIQAD
jgi:hypothetical protein